MQVEHTVPVHHHTDGAPTHMPQMDQVSASSLLSSFQNNSFVSFIHALINYKHLNVFELDVETGGELFVECQMSELGLDISVCRYIVVFIPGTPYSEFSEFFSSASGGRRFSNYDVFFFQIGQREAISLSRDSACIPERH